MAQIIPAKNSARLKIGGMTFQLNPERASAFKPLEQHRIYYLPHSQKILSAEVTGGE